MKKFFEKHDLFKIACISVLITCLLTWFFKTGAFTNGEYAASEMARVGIFDLSVYSLLGIYYFTVVFMFIFVVFGFYKFVGSVNAYQVLTDNIAKKFDGKEKLIVSISTLIFACLAGIVTEPLALFVFIPFVITILSKLKVDKISGLASTFGGILIGMLGSTYGEKVTGQLANASYGVGVTYGYELISTIVIFAIALLLLLFFVFVRMNNKKRKDVEILEDIFASSESTTQKIVKKVKKAKVSTLPMTIIMILLFVLFVLAFIGWESSFGISTFNDLHTWITEATLFGQPIYGYVLGNTLSGFGSWDLLTASALLFIITLVIKIIYRVPADNVISEYREGIKSSVKTIAVLMAIYSIIAFSYFFPILPTIINGIIKSIGNNIGGLYISGALSQIFFSDLQYGLSVIGSVYSSFKDANVAAYILQVSRGVTAFIAPTSGILMLGLSALNIKFKDYFKFIWKFLLAILVISIIIISVLMYA